MTRFYRSWGDPMRGFPSTGHLARKIRLYGGSFYEPDNAGGFVFDFGFQRSLQEIVDGYSRTEDPALRSNWIGYLPPCEFDELTMTMSHPTEGYVDTQDVGKSVAAIAFQKVRFNTQDAYSPREISGIESAWMGKKEPFLMRERLLLPFRSAERKSVTFGGPITPDAPTYLFFYANNITFAEAAGWQVQATIRFVMQPVEAAG